jgi:hypothetical protein
VIRGKKTIIECVGEGEGTPVRIITGETKTKALAETSIGVCRLFSIYIRTRIRQLLFLFVIRRFRLLQTVRVSVRVCSSVCVRVASRHWLCSQETNKASSTRVLANCTMPRCTDWTYSLR